MAIEAVGGSLTIPNGTTATVTPPVGETWSITNLSDQLWTSTGSYYTSWTVGGTANNTHPRVSLPSSGYTANWSTPVGPIILTNTLYLGLYAYGNQRYVNYSGVKL